jgi:hypothetical protein
MEHITLIAETTFSRKGIESEFSRLWIGQEEIPVGGRSISQCLEEMVQQGWKLTITRARADLHGIICEYNFERPSSVVEQPHSHDALTQQQQQ